MHSAHDEQPGWAPEGASPNFGPLMVHLDAAYNLARWLMRDDTEAEDMVQEAYLRAFRHFSSFRGGDGRAWLLTIVRNGCYNRLKQNGYQERTTTFDESVHSDGRQTLDPENCLLQAERAGLLRQSLEELPAMYREVLILRELEELSYDQIANIAGIPLGTVMSRLNRARQRLQQGLSADRRVLPNLSRSGESEVPS